MKEVEPTVSPWNLKYDILSSVKSLKKPLLNVAGSLLRAVILYWSSEIDIWSGVRPSFSLTWKGSRYNQQSITMRDMLIFSLIMYMKKNNALLIGWKRVRSQVIRVQSYNRSLFRLYWLPVMYFSCSLLTKSNMISLAICVINTCKLSKDYKFHLPYGLVIFCCLWKIYSCLLTPSSLEIIFLPILIAWLRWWGEARMNFFSSRRSRYFYFTFTFFWVKRLITETPYIAVKHSTSNKCQD